MDLENDRVGGKRKHIASGMRNRRSVDEITELEAELKRGYLRKELKVQIEADKLSKNLKSIETKLENESNRLKVLLESKENDNAKIRQRMKLKEEAIEENAKRIAKEAEQRDLIKEEGLKEREILQEVDRRLDERMNAKMLERKLELTRGRLEESRILSEMKEIRLISQKAEEDKLEKDRQSYLLEIERRIDLERTRKIQIQERRERVLASLIATIIQENTNKRERKRLLEELVYEELELDHMFNEWKQRNVKRRMTKELMDSLEEQMRLTESCKASFLRRDQEFAEETKKRLAEDEKILRLTADARKRVLFKYRQDLERMILERKMIRDLEIRKIQEEVEENVRLERFQERSIKEKRESLLREHAPNVGEFLNKNFLLTEEERRILSLSSKNEDDGSTKIRGMLDSKEDNNKNDDTDIVKHLNDLRLSK